MSWGLHVTNRNGIVVIDGTNPNYAEILRGTATIPANQRQVWVSIPAQGDLPLVLYQPGVTTDGDDYVAGEVRTNGFFLRRNRPSNGLARIVKYVVLNRVTSASGSGYGLRVFNSGGDVVYDTLRRFPRVVQTFRREITSIPDLDRGFSFWVNIPRDQVYCTLNACRLLFLSRSTGTSPATTEIRVGVLIGDAPPGQSLPITIGPTTTNNVETPSYYTSGVWDATPTEWRDVVFRVV